MPSEVSNTELSHATQSACIIGASGYTGAELVKLICRHPILSLKACFVSKNSDYQGMTVNQVHAELTGVCELPLIALDDQILDTIAHKYDHVFLATPHEFSHDCIEFLLKGKAKIYDLSGAFRISDVNIFSQFYGFEHKQKEALQKATYGLAEWHQSLISNSDFIAVPGCYPTASLLALKPLVESGLLDNDKTPVINAVSGVSGAGKKASATTSFVEVSLQAYGVLSHRHTPEIEEYAKSPVIFTPHLGSFKRGILATLTAFTKPGVAVTDIAQAYETYYANSTLVRVVNGMPKLDNVVHTPFSDIGFAFSRDKNCVVVTCAIDNLLKGASSQAIQCCNMVMQQPDTLGLI